MAARVGGRIVARPLVLGVGACALFGSARHLLCGVLCAWFWLCVAGRVAWRSSGCVGVKRERREPVWLVPSSLFFCFVERMTGLEPAAFTLGG